MLTIIDNYDSFVHTLAGYCRMLGVPAQVVRNDKIDLDGLQSAQAIILSPGPGAPDDAGICLDAVRALNTTPILGICLGHQVIGQAFGAKIGRTSPVHGRTSKVQHDGTGLFAGLPCPVELARYHSLAVCDPPPTLQVDARSDDGVVMAISHRDRPVWGVQPHPEAVLSRYGHALLANFLRLAGFRPAFQGAFAEFGPVLADRKAESAVDFYAEPIEPAYPLPRP